MRRLSSRARCSFAVMDARITVVTLGVSDLVRSRRFYCDGLGWRPSSSSNEHITFIQAGSVVLALYPIALLAEDAQLPARTGNGFGGIALAHNVRTPAEVDQALAAAERAGATILKTARQVF